MSTYVSDQKAVRSFHEKAGLCQEQNQQALEKATALKPCRESLPLPGSGKSFRHRGRAPSRPNAESRREALTGDRDARLCGHRQWQTRWLGGRSGEGTPLAPSFFLCKITASVAILPSALLNEPFRLHASWAFSFQWVLSICISTSISPDAQGVRSWS